MNNTEWTEVQTERGPAWHTKSYVHGNASITMAILPRPEHQTLDIVANVTVNEATVNHIWRGYRDLDEAKAAAMEGYIFLACQWHDMNFSNLIAA